MFDVFLQREIDLKFPDCGGVLSKTENPASKKELLFHYDTIEIKDSIPIAQETQSAFYLLANGSKSFFSLCDDPKKLDRNELEKYLQRDIERISRTDPLVHLKEIVARPILDLKEDEVKQPTSRVKKFIPRALEYLAGHSEDWRNRSFVGVHPLRLQSLVREDKWETYENRLLYTLCKILYALINQRLRELKSVDDSYREIQKYYEIVNSVNYDAMQREVDSLLINYSSEQVVENRKLLNTTYKFLKRLQQSIEAFWNSQLFGNLKRSPNVEVDINQFIMTNILMNNQHYLYLPQIQKEVVNFRSKEPSRQEKLEDQRQLLANEITYIERCIDDFAKKRESLWSILNPTLTKSEIEISLECCSKKLRFSFASSKPSKAYATRIADSRGENNTVSILVYPQEKPYLDEEEDGLDKLFSIFDKQLSQMGPYSLLGISPQSIFSKLLIQRILLQWMWPMLIAQYPVKIPQTRFIKELIPGDCILGDYLFKPYDISKFMSAVDQKERIARVKKNDLPAFHKARDKERMLLDNANKLIGIVHQCLCCGQTGILNDTPIPQNFMITCNNCGCRWSKNKDTIKWIKAASRELYGLLENFSAYKTA